jgi:hypothetical protein
MKNLSFIVMLVLASGMFLTSCEKEHECNPLNPGVNTYENMYRDGDIITDTDSDVDTETDQGTITDGGRDEDFDKTKKKRN